MKELKINHLAVWVTALIVQFVPPLWYSEVFFGIRWSELNELTAADFAEFNLPVGLLVNLLTCVIAAYAMAWLFTRLKVDTGFEGLKVALLIWVAFVFFEMLTQNLFSLRSLELTLIDQSVVLVKYEITGVILGLWSHYRIKDSATDWRTASSSQNISA